jgi:hypothetical protein
VSVAFKSRKGLLDPVEHSYINPVDGIYLADGSAVTVLLDTTMNGQGLDPAAPVGSKISALSFEREGLRGRWLGVSATMLNATTTESLAGIYSTKLEGKPIGVQAGYYSGLLRHDHIAGRVSVLVQKSRAFSGTVKIGRGGSGDGFPETSGPADAANQAGSDLDRRLSGAECDCFGEFRYGCGGL